MKHPKGICSPDSSLARLGLLLLIACGNSERAPLVRDAGPGSAHKIVPVVAAPAGFVGVIAAAESVDIAPRFQGVIAAIRVRPGDKVTAGQIIAEMDQKSMLEELRAAEAALGAAAAAKRQAEVDVEDSKRKSKLEAVNADARYHAAMIHLTMGDFPGALALADTIQADAPGHLFANIVRGEAADRDNDTALLSRSYRDFLDHYDRELKAGRVEYQEHRPILEDFRTRAKASLGR